MRHFISSLTIILTFCGIVFCYSFTDRIQELEKQNQQIDQEIAKRQQEIRGLVEMKLINIGRIEELKRIEKSGIQMKKTEIKRKNNE